MLSTNILDNLKRHYLVDSTNLIYTFCILSKSRCEMALTVKDLLTLPSLKGFKLIAGEKGLSNDVIAAGIADYEFVQEINYDLSKAFEKDSLVISSLLFAKDNPEIILQAIKTLKESGVSAFAYKQILFESLPQEVLNYAEEQNFPVFSFKDEAWFENIIFDIMAAVERDDSRHLSEFYIEKMINASASKEEVSNIRYGISLLLDKTVSACYVNHSKLDANRVFRSFYMSKSLREKVLVSKYDKGIFILITTPKWSEEAHRIILTEACQTLSLPIEADEITLSQLHPAAQLDKAFREGYFAWVTKTLLNRKTSSFSELGVFSAILPLSNTKELKDFSKEYMAKVCEYEDTITAYIRNSGDIVAASLDLDCHSNTVRYRLNKIKELVNAPNETDHELFRDLSIAYIISKVLE